MNVVVFCAYAVNTPHFEVELEIAHGHLDDGDQVTMLTCGGELESCDPNPFHDPPRCAYCMGRRDAGLALLPSSVSVERFYRLTDDDRRELDALPTSFESIDELKALRVGEFDIGYAALSSLISTVREPLPDMERHATLLRGLLRASWTVHRSMMRYLKTHAVDRVYVFNGRYSSMRAVLRACQEQGVDCFTHERGSDLTRYLLLPNSTIHDAEIVRPMMWEAWESAGEGTDCEAVAREWYESRAKGGGTFAYVGGQRRGRLPADWDPGKRNISVFVSSEDEYAAISDHWKNPLYESQNAGLRNIIESLRDDPGNLHLYIRTHPNLALVDNTQTRGLKELAAPFITVIPPADPVDTYAMIRNSASVLTFGSSVGIEAVYWGVPSILAGMNLYRDLGVTYNPRTHEELIELLHTELQPQMNDSVLKYGYFWATLGTPHNRFVPDGTFQGRFKGVQIKPSLLVRVRVFALRVTHPRRVTRHIKKQFSKRWRIFRNKVRPRA